MFYSHKLWCSPCSVKGNKYNIRQQKEQHSLFQTQSPTVILTEPHHTYFYENTGSCAIILVWLVMQAQLNIYIYITQQQTRPNSMVYPHPMHLHFPSLKQIVLRLCVVTYVYNCPPYLFWYIQCKNAVSTYFHISEQLYSCMSTVKNPHYSLRITKLKQLVILMILISTICTIFIICIPYENPTRKINSEKKPPTQPYSFQNKQ